MGNFKKASPKRTYLWPFRILSTPALLSGWWFQTWMLFSPDIWDVILPIDELHHVSRWLLHHQPVMINHPMCGNSQFSDKPILLGLGESPFYPQAPLPAGSLASAPTWMVKAQQERPLCSCKRLHLKPGISPTQASFGPKFYTYHLVMTNSSSWFFDGP